MKNIICKLTLSRLLVVGCCSGTFSVAKECMLSPQHRRFVECDQDSKRGASSLSQLALVQVRPLLNKESDITGNHDVQQTAFTFVEAREDLDLKHRIIVRNTPAGFYSVNASVAKNSTIYQHTIWRIHFIVRQNTSQGIFGHLVSVRSWTCLISVLASGRLRCVRCEGENLKHSAGQHWMWRVFKLSVQC